MVLVLSESCSRKGARAGPCLARRGALLTIWLSRSDPLLALRSLPTASTVFVNAGVAVASEQHPALKGPHKAAEHPVRHLTGACERLAKLYESHRKRV